MTATNHLSMWIAISSLLGSRHNPVDRLSTCLLPFLLLCHLFQILFNSCYLQLSSFHFCEDLHVLLGLVMVSSPSTLVDHSDSFIITEPHGSTAHTCEWRLNWLPTCFMTSFVITWHTFIQINPPACHLHAGYYSISAQLAWFLLHSSILLSWK